ncbi:Uncharacterised protein [Brevundimonas vesicularis]|uniref:Nuclease n=1 Tax=Brevundimonas vesicularis TaxID=41276 RepID=A0A2X1BFU3_BREVE|nr:nuclease [Brevundimonas vesicularis]SPU55270.1 Uncharacterised protein [Brevundimonas vesicularis]
MPNPHRSLLSLSALGLCTLFLAAMATPASADPCEGRLPSQSGQQFTGSVRYIGDGDSLCVGSSRDPNSWIEVRLADFEAPELHSPDGRRSQSLLRQVAFGQNVVCEARRGRSGRVIVHDRVIAVCRVRGRPIGDLLRARHAPEGGN